MTDIYLHGIETVEKNEGPRPVQTIDTGIIGLIGTAPDANATNWPLNTPVAVYGYNGVPSGLGTNGTLYDAITGILDQATRASQTIVVVRVTEGADTAETMDNIVGDAIAKTGVHAFRKAWDELNLVPKILIAPGFTGIRPTDGVDAITITEGGTGYPTDGSVVITITDQGATGSGASAEPVINSDTGTIEDIVITNGGQGYTGPLTISVNDVNGVGDTDATFTGTVGTVNNPVVAELLVIANRLRSCVIADGPNTTSADAVTYRLGYDTDRLLILDPYCKIWKGGAVVSEPASARAAGLQARVDYEEGFWFSLSNHVIEGILGAGRTVEHSLSDPSAESQYLNKNAVATIVRSPTGGYKLWGSRVPSSDTLKQFWSVRRSHDTIIRSIEIAHEPFVDKPFGLQILVDIAETVNAALRRWQALGATLGGRVWLDPSINTKETWASGHLYVSYDTEAPAPLEHITFMFNRNTGYYERLAFEAIREIERLAVREG